MYPVLFHYMDLSTTGIFFHRSPDMDGGGLSWGLVQVISTLCNQLTINDRGKHGSASVITKVVFKILLLYGTWRYT